MQLTEETIFIISLILSIIGVFVVILLGSRIKEQLKVLNAINEDIESSEFYLETLKENTKSKLDELEKAKVELECVKGQFEDIVEACHDLKDKCVDFKDKCLELSDQFKDAKDQFLELNQKVEELGIYVVAAEALAEGREFDIELFKVHEVSFLDKCIGNLQLRKSVLEALKEVKINKVWELVNTSKNYLLSLPGVGPAAVDEISRILGEHDCYLDMPFINVDGRYYTNKA